MPFPDTILFYVEDIPRSQAFYTQLLGVEPAIASPGFVLYATENAPKLAIWKRAAAMPAASVTGGGGEINFTASSRHQVDGLYATWKKNGVIFLQEPTDIEFIGYTFVAADPDGHRMRVFFDPEIA